VTAGVVRTRAELAETLATVRRSQAPVVLVPTMGALHEAHAALVRRARELAGPYGEVVVSVFVNPLQFGPAEDLARYPRSLDADVDLAGDAGASVVFAPSVEVVYDGGQPLVRVAAGPVGGLLEGAARPGHFDGVLTVVLKLFGLVRPDVAVFGEKDAQQLALVRRMVRDLDVPVRIEGHPTVRSESGLALSSRNRYLDEHGLRTAAAIAQALAAGGAAASGGLPAASVAAAAREVLDAEGGLDVDYCVVVDPETFEPPAPAGYGDALLLVAARVGTTRLIDNARVRLQPTGGGP
jgi:pantoate--beta-alanine ligase